MIVRPNQKSYSRAVITAPEPLQVSEGRAIGTRLVLKQREILSGWAHCLSWEEKMKMHANSSLFKWVEVDPTLFNLETNSFSYLALIK